MQESVMASRVWRGLLLHLYLKVFLRTLNRKKWYTVPRFLLLTQLLNGVRKSGTKIDNMKMKRLATRLIVSMIMCFTITACEKDDGNTSLNSNPEIDPEGTIIVNLRHENSIDLFSYEFWNEIKKDGVALDESNNIVSYPYSETPCVKIALVGSVSGLSEVSNIPESGWTNTIAAIPGTGYVVQHWFRFDNSTHQHYYEPQNEYARIYVVDYLVNTVGGIEGVIIKYQCPWIP